MSNFIHIGLYISVLFEDELETSTLSTTTLQELTTPVLILSTPCYAHYIVKNCMGPPTPPLIIDKFGHVNANFTFDFETELMVFKSCGLTWQNEHYVFGGTSINGAKQSNKVAR